MMEVQFRWHCYIHHDMLVVSHLDKMVVVDLLCIAYSTFLLND